MIRNTLQTTKAATFAVLLPDPNRKGFPTPIGTGFFVSPDGIFVTAAHVVTVNNLSNGPVRDDISQAWLFKEPSGQSWGSKMCQAVDLVFVNPDTDFALFKIDFEANKGKDWLKDKTSFPFLRVSSRILEEGEPVYAFGYPLSESDYRDLGEHQIGGIFLSPRTTTAIVSSCFEETMVTPAANTPGKYVLDRALNYGNSGGPIVATSTGNVHAFCSQFQPVFIPQDHLRDPNGNMTYIMIPSLYGIVQSLANIKIIEIMQKFGVPILDY